MSKAGHRWKTVSKMTIEIQIASSAKCWRAVSAVEKTPPQPNESEDNAVLKVGKGETYKITALIRRIQKKQEIY